MRKGKPPKVECEVCGEKDVNVLHHHHIVERTELNSDNSWYNLAVICANCHNKTHAGGLEIIGVYPSTKPPYGRILVYKQDGVCNVPGIEEAYYTPKAPSMKVYYAAKDDNKTTDSDDKNGCSDT